MSLLPYHKGNKTNFINLLFTLTPSNVKAPRPPAVSFMTRARAPPARSREKARAAWLISQSNSQSSSPARWFHVIHPPIFSHSAHFVPYKTFLRNKTPLKTHLVQLKTFIWNEIDKNIYGIVTYATRLHKILWLFLTFL